MTDDSKKTQKTTRREIEIALQRLDSFVKRRRNQK